MKRTNQNQANQSTKKQSNQGKDHKHISIPEADTLLESWEFSNQDRSLSRIEIEAISRDLYRGSIKRLDY